METTLTQIHIRSASSDDIVRLEEFIRPFTQERKLLRRTLKEIEDLLDHFFIAEVNGEVVGCAALEIYSPKLAEIRSLAVSPSVQGSGVGKKLVEKCLETAHQHNVFEVMAISSSEGFFKACGFDFTLPGERKAFFLQTRDEL
jgi:N-acetylglutamate synthase-like GNAT family acetyltransferase